MQNKQTAKQLVDHAFNILGIMYDSHGLPMKKLRYSIKAKEIARAKILFLIEHGNLDSEELEYWREVMKVIDNCRP